MSALNAKNIAIAGVGWNLQVRLFKSTATIEIQEEQHPNLEFSSHGHGVRRQFVMSAFRGLATQLDEVKRTAKQRRSENYELAAVIAEPGKSKSRMLLIEEPELFLHPAAIRSVRNLLFALASSSEFQVMAATHSPVIIDLSRPHTTLARVTASETHGTSVYQVSSTLFSKEDRETMKMLNNFDPYVCEAFFASRVILVEGDTEAVAIRELIHRWREQQQNPALDELHVVNCGTKMNIPFFQKVLTHFRIPHSIFHDLDKRLDKNGDRSPAWTLNERIWADILEARASNVAASRFVFDTDFESANGYTPDDSVGKPFTAFRQATSWDLNDESRAAIHFLRLVMSDTQHDPEFTQQTLENLAP